MTNYNTLLFCITICVNFLGNRAYKLNAEGIVGGHPAFQENHKYQVAILAKRNYSVKNDLVCSGAIISANFILTVAQCFFDQNLNLKELTFTLLMGISNLIDEGVRGFIDIIYLPGVSPFFSYADIAIAKPEEDSGKLLSKRCVSLRKYCSCFLFLQDQPSTRILLYSTYCQHGGGFNLKVSKVKLPKPQSYFRREGTVAGYGYQYIEFGGIENSRKRLKSNSQSNSQLKYAFVRAVDINVCTERYGRLNNNSHICGVMKSDYSVRGWGICKNDEGSPLVIDDELVGLASLRSFDCDDTIYGAVYTNVTSYMYFINAVLNGNPNRTEFEFFNRQHISSKGRGLNLYLSL